MSQFQDSFGEYREKRAGSIADFGLDWERFLAGDTIDTSTWEVPAGITEEPSPPPSNTDTTTTIWLSGGTEDQEYVLINTVTTTGGRTWLRPLRIKVVAVLRPLPQVSASQQLEELTQIRNTGAKEIETRPGGYRRVEYRDLSELDQIKGDLEAEVSGSPTPASRCSLASHRRG